MKTHVRTKLGWSKLVLVAAVLAVVAMLSVIGLCFTNANADDTADPANAEINIPVSILNPEITTTGKWEATKWSPDPKAKFELSGDFSNHHTYPIEEKHQWVDNEECKATYDKDVLIITLASNDTGDVLYKTWKISNKLDGSSWYLVVDGKAEKMVQGKSMPLKAGLKYSFFYGEPQIFDVVSNTIDAPNYAVDGNDFDGNSVAMQGQFPATFTLNSQAVVGKAYFEAGNPYTLTLVFSDKYIDSVYHIAVNGKLIEGDDYYWTFNKELISTNPQEPTDIYLNAMGDNPFTFEKKPAPEPIKSFKVVGTVFDYEGNVIPNADIWFYNSDVDFDLEPPLLTTKAGEDGKFALDGCYPGAKYPEDLTLVVMAKHYSGETYNIDYEDAQGGLVDMDETHPIVLEPAVIDIYSDNPHHKSFILKVVDQYPGEEPEVVQYKKMEYIGIEGIKSNGSEDYIYNVQDAGVLYNQSSLDEGGIETVTITPEPEDGFTFANYLINDVDSYTVGQSIDLTKYAGDESGIHVQVNYNSADSEKIAQTGDSNVYAALALTAIVIAAGVVYIVRRKNENF